MLVNGLDCVKLATNGSQLPFHARRLKHNQKHGAFDDKESAAHVSFLNIPQQNWTRPSLDPDSFELLVINEVFWWTGPIRVLIQHPIQAAETETWLEEHFGRIVYVVLAAISPILEYRKDCGMDVTEESDPGKWADRERLSRLFRSVHSCRYYADPSFVSNTSINRCGRQSRGKMPHRNAINVAIAVRHWRSTLRVKTDRRLASAMRSLLSMISHPFILRSRYLYPMTWLHLAYALRSQ